MSKSKNWNFRVLGIISLMLIAGLFAGTAMAAPSTSITSGGDVPAGSSGNTITISINPDGATSLTVQPPFGWTDMQNTNSSAAGYTSANVSITTAGTPSADSTTDVAAGITITSGTPLPNPVVVTYGAGGGASGAVADRKIRSAKFTIKVGPVGAEVAILGADNQTTVFTRVDGSGQIEISGSGSAGASPNERQATGGTT